MSHSSRSRHSYGSCGEESESEPRSERAHWEAPPGFHPGPKRSAVAVRVSGQKPEINTPSNLARCLQLPAGRMKGFSVDTWQEPFDTRPERGVSALCDITWGWLTSHGGSERQKEQKIGLVRLLEESLGPFGNGADVPVDPSSFWRDCGLKTLEKGASS